jgi:hypothetical protein
MCNPGCDDDAKTSTILNSSSTSNEPLILGRDISNMKSGVNMASVLLPTSHISGATVSIVEPMTAVCKVQIITEMRQVVARSLQPATPSKSQLLIVWMDHTFETTEELHNHEDHGEHALIISNDHTAECRKGRAHVKSLRKLKGQLEGQLGRKLDGKLEGPFISRSWKAAAAEWAKFCAPHHRLLFTRFGSVT